ncbi:protein-disulfide reductase DsbD domain-containing protein [Rhodovulum euryhalinum]|uniref:DsbC/DsbD-like thiol-disulfide interchange protein n=1 Tax=Rhodovulum euryhalinum TaxID=35805 RepID=A0A4V2SAC5_9RHOB|nr:protein-disulfide reductase DsbD domain-containing protein [Rhodovulum euryhalinum]TCO71150.1 DsbC/DsbD-like thiol-disulfide interchange protein [Rhodovulum euryhalinum]
MDLHIIQRLAAAAALALGLSQSALAGAPEGVISARFLPGWQTADGTYMAGLHLHLAPGWKTYWRAPGDAGIPPRFDWAGSGNMAAVRVHWPTPKVFSSNGLRTIGYEHEVVLPLELTPRDPGRPMELHARVELGVCHEICMPMELRLTGLLPAEGGAEAIRAALDARPRTAQEARVGTVTCTLEPIADGLRLTAEIDVSALGAQETVVFELPDPSIWVSEAEMARKGGRLVARSDLVPAAGTPFALDRSGLRITLLGEGRGVDIHGCAGR